MFLKKVALVSKEGRHENKKTPPYNEAIERGPMDDNDNTQCFPLFLNTVVLISCFI
jgi:hypothetical protein